MCACLRRVAQSAAKAMLELINEATNNWRTNTYDLIQARNGVCLFPRETLLIPCSLAALTSSSSIAS